MALEDWRQVLGQGLLLLGASGIPGCQSSERPAKLTGYERPTVARGIPAARDHVSIFLINGMDPTNFGNMTGLRDHLHQAGYSRVVYGQVFHAGDFEQQLRAIRQADAQAKFVLIGFSMGASRAFDIASAVQADPINIDLIVCLSGNYPLSRLPKERPPNVRKVVNVLASGLMKNAGQRDYAENIRLPGAWHYGTPTHPTTLQVIDERLAGLAQ